MADKTGERPIRTDYYAHDKIVKRTASKWAHMAVPNITRHLQWADWDATHAEVYDTAHHHRLLAVVRMTLVGGGGVKIETLFKAAGIKEIQNEKEES